MAKFIEVSTLGIKRLINADWIEEIRQEDESGTTIYFAFTCPGAIDQDYAKVDQTYEELYAMLMGERKDP